MTEGEIRALFKSVEDENKRQNERILTLEKNMEQFNQLAISISKMTASIDNIAKQIEGQGERLAHLEKKPADMFEKIVATVLTALVGGFVGFLINGTF